MYQGPGVCLPMLHLRQGQQSLGVVAHEATSTPRGAVLAVVAVVPGAEFPVHDGFRVVDGFDAASFIQRLRALLEQPALLFMAQP